jgi:hypothetical protein
MYQAGCRLRLSWIPAFAGMTESWLLTMLCAALLGGCSFEPSPQPPGLLVATAPPGASCLLTRQGKAIAYIGSTPAIARGVDHGGAVRVACGRLGFTRTVVDVAPSGSTPAYPERVDIALTPALPGMRLPPPR